MLVRPFASSLCFLCLFIKPSSNDEAGRLSEAPAGTYMYKCLGLHVDTLYIQYCTCSYMNMSAYIQWRPVG